MEKPEIPQNPSGKKIADDFVDWMEKIHSLIKKDPVLFRELRHHVALEKSRSENLFRRVKISPGDARDMIQEEATLNRRVGLMEILLVILE